MDSLSSSTNRQPCGDAWRPLLIAGAAVAYSAVVAGMLAAVLARVGAVVLVSIFG